ncbi:MAG: hypothetical protein F4X74_04685 [Acidimicrobiia bacterium]|nr:hypothetical protein [Acidimicrobiia bacterium]
MARLAIAAIVLSLLVPAPLAASTEPEGSLPRTAQTDGADGAEAIPAGRVTCGEAPTVFEVLCIVYRLISATMWTR